uniref:Uncharacterized protein n=1 Tax=Trichuris muris TaxID=70415 RepID=A0A5S6QPI1_TRIMR
MGSSERAVDVSAASLVTHRLIERYCVKTDVQEISAMASCRSTSSKHRMHSGFARNRRYVQQKKRKTVRVGTADELPGNFLKFRVCTLVYFWQIREAQRKIIYGIATLHMCSYP